MSKAWLKHIDSIYDQDCEFDEKNMYNGGYLDIKVRTYHLKEYPFKDQYNLEIKYAENGKMVVICEIDDISSLEQEVKMRMDELRREGKYKARISIDEIFLGNID